MFNQQPQPDLLHSTASAARPALPSFRHFAPLTNSPWVQPLLSLPLRVSSTRLRIKFTNAPPALKLDKTIPLPPVSASRGASGKPELTRARLPSQHRGEDSHSSPTAGCARTAAAATRQERTAAREAAGSPSETTQGGRASSPMKHLAGSGETTPPRAGTFSVGGDQKAERRPMAAQLEAIAAKSRSSTPGNWDPKLGQRTAAKTEVPLDLHVRETSLAVTSP
ncbi:uncharacterized protein LOC124417392 isoform X2 [Gallus gallus]|uniref:uncharacterized protein LOC124417392 isoform X2 n=1 Tax=Gallus gallus TaxID=9031 RepID=UPI001F01F70C|nr:uncharacterized protein LOC124417392 isoform X2 [Gallus gallus]